MSARPPRPSISPPSLALADQRVLLVDIDPQGNLTSGVGSGQAAPAGTIYDALTADADGPPRAVRPATGVDGLSLIPADRNLTGAEIELVACREREHRLRLFLEPLRDRVRLHLHRHARRRSAC